MGDNPYKFTTEEGEIPEPGQEDINLYITNTLETLTFLLSFLALSKIFVE